MQRNDLQAHGQSRSVEPYQHGDRWMAGAYPKTGAALNAPLKES
jgi:hypothetical protein